MPTLYQLALLGSPTDVQISELEAAIGKTVSMFNLRLGHEVGWEVRPNEFNPDQQRSSAAIFFGGKNPPLANVAKLLERGIPLLPVASDVNQVSAEIPTLLQPLHCLPYSAGGQRIATALLECVGLLPRQRRVFISYRRTQAEEAAIQLFNALSARLFDVFLDTHGIPPAADFQAMLWHRLCDSDVLLMLDTPNYFESRWTEAEFGRALAKGIGILRVGWPDIKPSLRIATASQIELSPGEVHPTTGQLAANAVDSICSRLEEVRSESCAVRAVNLVSKLRNAIQTIGGKTIGVGTNNAIYVQLPDGQKVIVHPTVGVPTSITLHDASTNSPSPNQSVAVVYDSVGLDRRWLEHLDWLGQHIHSVRWVKAHEAGWQFADWKATP